jgi:hypothetical protein
MPFSRRSQSSPNGASVPSFCEQHDVARGPLGRWDRGGEGGPRRLQVRERCRSGDLRDEMLRLGNAAVLYVEA